MKTLIIYTSRTDSTMECARLLAREISEADLCNIERESPNINAYDAVILGSGVRMRKIYKPMKRFMESSVDALATKKLAVYLCNAYPDTFIKASKSIPLKIRGAALCIESFGGKAPFSKESDSNHKWMKRDKIEQFVEMFCQQ